MTAARNPPPAERSSAVAQMIFFMTITSLPFNYIFPSHGHFSVCGMKKIHDAEPGINRPPR